jgi:hypothetical protein
VVDQRKKESLFFGNKLTRFDQLWVVGVWDLRARGNMLQVLSISVAWTFSLFFSIECQMTGPRHQWDSSCSLIPRSHNEKYTIEFAL